MVPDVIPELKHSLQGTYLVVTDVVLVRANMTYLCRPGRRHSDVTFVCVRSMVTLCSQYVTSMESVFTPRKRT